MSMRHLLTTVAIAPFIVLGACGGGGGGSTPPVIVNPPPPLPPPPPPPPPPPTGNIDISGHITFDSVPHNTVTNGLNYAGTTQRPARGITVEAVNAGGTVLATDQTDDSGNYTVTVTGGSGVRIRAKAQMIQTSGARWDVSVLDNTNGNSLYAVQGALVTPTTVTETRNLNAGSGWGGSSYTGTRAAAPFAILSPIYDSMQKFAAVDSAVNFPALDIGWSVNNRAVNGNDANGEIGTSNYSSADVRILLLGDDNSDTDEYDSHVVIHEWGHYFEDQLARSDSTGGSHSGTDRLDPRLAFSEGWGNALSGMITDDPIYRDSLGSQQAQGFDVNVESDTAPDPGWFNERSAQAILYDIYDSNNDGVDVISSGLGPVYAAFTAADYRTNPVFTTIFTYADAFLDVSPSNTANINALLTAQDINSTVQTGAGETNNGNIATALPLYKPVTVNGPATEICSVNDAGTANKLGNRAYLTFTAAAGSHTLTMTRKSGAASRDPDFIVYRQGTVVATAQSGPAESESWTGALQAGAHAVDAYDFFNLGSGTNPSGDSCYDFRVTAP